MTENKIKKITFECVSDNIINDSEVRKITTNKRDGLWFDNGIFFGLESIPITWKIL